MKPKIILTLIIILCFRVGLAGCASLLQSLRGPTEPFLCQGSIWLDDHDRNPKNKTDHQCMPRTPFTTQWADPSLLGMSSSRLLFLMLFSMQVGIVIPVLLVFHASLCFIMLTMDIDRVDHVDHVQCSGRRQGFPVRDINTGNATGFTFMQVMRGR